MLGVVIPAYRRTDCLREALNSLVAQTYTRFFVIVVDDHSEIPLWSVVEPFEEKLHIRYVYADRNGGPGAARQIGLDLCKEAGLSEVMFLDSDDMLMPHAIARLTVEMRRNMCDVVSSGIWWEDGKGLGAPISADNKTWLHGKIFRMQYLIDNNINFADIRTNEDLAFCLSVIESTEKKATIDENLYLFRYEKGSITRGDKPEDLYSEHYIEAIFYAVKCLEQNGHKITDQLIINILSCYNRYQIGMVQGVLTKDTIDKLKYLINLEEVKRILDTPKEFAKVERIFRQYAVIDNKVIYFKQTLKEWLEEFIDEDSCN